MVRQAQIKARADDQLKGRLKDHLRKLSELQTDSEKIQWVRSQVDCMLDDSVSESKCERGCHFCCFHPISLSRIEMKDILETETVQSPSRLVSQRKHFGNGESISYEERACVYLKEGQCSIYQKRPLICRLTHVSSRPENCNYENEMNPIEHLPVTEAALLVGAFYMAHPDIEIMSLLIEETDKSL